MRAPLAPPRLSLPRNDEAAAHAAETSAAPTGRRGDSALSTATSAASMSWGVTAGIGSCQISTSGGTSGPR